MWSGTSVEIESDEMADGWGGAVCLASTGILLMPSLFSRVCIGLCFVTVAGSVTQTAGPGLIWPCLEDERQQLCGYGDVSTHIARELHGGSVIDMHVKFRR